MSDDACFIKLLTVEMVISHAESLKDKRRAVRGLKDRVRSKFNASVAEVGYLDKWQRAVVAVCMVGNDKRKLDSDAARILTLCEETKDMTMTEVEQAWL